MDMQSQVTLLLEARARLHACCASASGLGSRRGRAACGCRRAVGFSRPLQRAQEAAKERNRTTLAQINAEIRREKAKLKATVPDLVKLSKKKLKRMPADEKAAEKARRAEKIAALETALDEVPDGTAHERKRREKLISASGPITLNVDVSSLQMQPVSMDHSKESEAFALEFKTSKAKQDEGLDVISKGLRTLKDMGHAMADELKKQDPLLDVIDDKATDATAELRTSNVKLKALLMEMRSPHKICLDLILISVLLGIGSYIFTLTRPGAAKKLVSSATSLLHSSPPPPAAAAPSRRLLGAWDAADAFGDAALHADEAVLRLYR